MIVNNSSDKLDADLEAILSSVFAKRPELTFYVERSTRVLAAVKGEYAGRVYKQQDQMSSNDTWVTRFYIKSPKIARKVGRSRSDRTMSHVFTTDHKTAVKKAIEFLGTKSESDEAFDVSVGVVHNLNSLASTCTSRINYRTNFDAQKMAMFLVSCARDKVYPPIPAEFVDSIKPESIDFLSNLEVLENLTAHANNRNYIILRQRIDETLTMYYHEESSNSWEPIRNAQYAVPDWAQPKLTLLKMLGADKGVRDVGISFLIHESGFDQEFMNYFIVKGEMQGE